jgi:membrane-bound inhibitor of C-type lysozyme
VAALGTLLLAAAALAEPAIRAPSGSGARYSDGQQEFWGKGQQDHWLRDLTNQEAPLHCTVATQAP